MKKIMAWVAVWIFIVGGAALFFWPISGPAAWRLYDENWKPLALTEAENWCAGYIGINDGWKKENPEVHKCVKGSNLDNEVPSISRSVGWGCKGVVAGGWNGNAYQCKRIVEENSLWFLVGGGFTSDWNDQRPRPVETAENLLEDEQTRENRASGIKPLENETEEDKSE